MQTRSLLGILVLGALIACSSGGDATDADTTATDATLADDAEASGSGEAAADSIPMTATIVLPTVRESSGTFHGGTFTSQGKGAQCERHDSGPMEWSVIFPGSEDSVGVAAVNLKVGRLVGGRTNHLFLMVVAGSVEAAGMRSPIIHVISTSAPGPSDPTVAPSKGSANVTVTREGPRVRFEIDGISGTTSKSFKMTLVCEREGKWV